MLIGRQKSIKYFLTDTMKFQNNDHQCTGCIAHWLGGKDMKLSEKWLPNLMVACQIGVYFKKITGFKGDNKVNSFLK